MKHRRLRLLAEPASVCRLPPDADVPPWATRAPFSSVTRTPDELSVTCPSRLVPRQVAAAGPFRALGLEGPIPFEETGVVAALAAPLAAARVSVLAIATHDTDWLLVRHEDLETAIGALREAGADVVRPPGRVDSVHFAAAEGEPMRVADPARLVADLGLEGDRYARSGSPRQVTVTFAEELEAAARELGAAILPGTTRRNVTVSGLGGAPPAGARLRLGPALVEVTGPAPPCRLMEEAVGPGALRALAGRAGVGARVLEGGVLAAGAAASIVDG